MKNLHAIESHQSSHTQIQLPTGKIGSQTIKQCMKESNKAEVSKNHLEGHQLHYIHALSSNSCKKHKSSKLQALKITAIRAMKGSSPQGCSPSPGEVLIHLSSPFPLQGHPPRWDVGLTLLHRENT